MKYFKFRTQIDVLFYFNLLTMEYLHADSHLAGFTFDMREDSL